MKKVFIVLFITINITLSLRGTTYYVSPTGNDAAAGTISSPWATWHYSFNRLNAGDILYVRGGIYRPAGIYSGGAYVGARIAYKNGTSSNPITISAYGAEVPVLDCSNVTQEGWKVGISVDGCSYIRFKGLTVQNVNEHGYGGRPADGWVGGASNHITLEQCTLTRCGGGFSFGGSCDYIYFTNCDSYNNCDLLFGASSSGGAGGYCNGFSQNGNAGTHVFYEGCRAWNNSDDGFDNMGGAGYITYNNCWAFENGHTLGDWTDIVGDGDGFKLGLTPEPKEAGAQRICTNCVAWNNDLGGFDESQDYGPVCDMTLYNCTAYNNKRSGFGFYSTSGGYTGIATLKNCISYKNDISGGGRQNVDLRASCILSNNSWQSGTVTDADFVSLTASAASGPRKADGSLPDISFMHLAAVSKLKDAGTNVGLPYYGSAPDIGAFETGAPVTVVIPVYVSSLIGNSTPTILEMTYNAALANVVPSASAFSVKVNSAALAVSSLKISGSKVLLTLQKAVKFGEVVTVSYTKPSSNPLQTATGGQAINISLRPVTNNLKDASQPKSPPVITLNNMSDAYSGFVYEIEPFVSYDLTTEEITYKWNVASNISVSSTTSPKIQFLAPSVNSSQTIQFQFNVSVGTTVVSKTIPIKILPYKPGLEIAKIKKTGASGSLAPDAPINATDGNALTKWTANGDNQWLCFSLSQPFKIHHLEIAFLSGQKYSSFFDIYASKDSINWQPILLKSTSCNFSGDNQVFVFPEMSTAEEYSYLKYVGHGNSLNSSNIVSEFKVFGSASAILSTAKKPDMVIYPNPVRNMLNISLGEPSRKPDKIRIIDYSGKIMLEEMLDPELKNLQIPVSLKSGLYIVELGSKNVFLFAQSLIVSN